MFFGDGDLQVNRLSYLEFGKLTNVSVWLEETVR
jgi:hypothetical protein